MNKKVLIPVLIILIIICAILLINMNRKEYTNKNNSTNLNNDAANVVEENNYSTINNIVINKESDEMENNTEVKVIINNKEYKAILEDNETVSKLMELLPIEYNMNELNGNEKYAYLDGSLPTNSYRPNHIDAGDVMLYGSDCLVVFYKSFDTSYSYTKIGHIEDLPDLGNSNITVKFEK